MNLNTISFLPWQARRINLHTGRVLVHYLCILFSFEEAWGGVVCWIFWIFVVLNVFTSSSHQLSNKFFKFSMCSPTCSQQYLTLSHILCLKLYSCKLYNQPKRRRMQYGSQWVGCSLQWVLAQAKNGQKPFQDEKFHPANGKAQACTQGALLLKIKFGRRIFSSLVPNVIPLGFQWVLNIFPKFPMCSPTCSAQHLILIPYALPNVVLLSPIQVGQSGEKLYTSKQNLLVWGASIVSFFFFFYFFE